MLSDHLPDGWAVASISEAMRSDAVISDGDWVESKDQDPRGNIRLIQLADIGDGHFRDKSERFMNREAADRLNCTYLQKGDILIARMPDPLGRACIFPGVGQESVTVVDVCLIRCSEGSAFSNRVLMDWINSPTVRSAIALQATGTTRKRITRKKLEALELPVPPLAEQKQIATKLDELLAQVDTLKTRLDAIPAILKRFRQSVLAAAVSGRLTEEWRGQHALTGTWKRYEIEHLAKREKYSLGIGPFGSNLKVIDYRTDGHPLVFVREIRAEAFGGDATKYVSTEKFNELKAHRVSPGDILITKMGDPPGDISVYPKSRPEAVITADCIKFTANESIVLTSFAYYSMKSEIFRGQVLGISAGVAQQKVNLKKFRGLTLDVPMIEEQAEIVRRVEELFTFANQIEQRINEAQSRVNHLTQSILAKAFRGELTAEWREQNPGLVSGDNSAAALLEKIKAERTEVAKQKRPARRKTKKKSEITMKLKQIIPVVEVLKAARKPLTSQQLLAEAGYPTDASVEQLESFFLDIREQLCVGLIARERRGDEELLTLVD